MIRNRKRSACAIGIFPQHRDVISFPDQPKTKLLQSAYDVLKRGHLLGISPLNGHLSLGNECLNNRWIGIDFIEAERFDMEFDG